MENAIEKVNEVNEVERMGVKFVIASIETLVDGNEKHTALNFATDSGHGDTGFAGCMEAKYFDTYEEALHAKRNCGAWKVCIIAIPTKMTCHNFCWGIDDEDGFLTTSLA